MKSWNLLLVCVVAASLGTVHSQQTCTLPSETVINSIISKIANSGGGEVSEDITINIISYHFTCLAVRETENTYSLVSAPVVYDKNVSGVITRFMEQFQISCIGDGVYRQADSWPVETNPPAEAFTAPTRRDCFTCAVAGSSLIDQVTNCAVCMQCQSLGQGACTAHTTCCPFYEGGSCTGSCCVNRIANAASNFTCVCNGSFAENSAGMCVDVCEPNPCQNGGNCTGVDNAPYASCACPPGFIGATCETASVSSSSSSSSTASSSTSIPIPTPDRDDNQITAFVIPVTITIISGAIILITICSIVTVVTCCLVLSKKRRRLSPPQDVVPVSANPAYEQVTLKSIALQENSAYSIVHTVSPPAAAVAEYEYIGDRKQLTANSPPQLDDEVSLSPNPAYRQVNRIDLQENSAYSTVHTVSPAAAVAQYENFGDRKHGNDELTAANSPPQQDEEVPVSANPAYRQVNRIDLQENSAYSIVHTVSPAAAQYKNIAVDDELTANSPPQYEVPVSPNPAYKQVTSIALQENSAYSIVHTVSPPAAAAAVAEYENIGDRKHGNDELTAANSPPQLDEISLSPNPAYRQVNNITLQENSAYSIVHTVSPQAAAATHYENIAVDDKLTVANSLPQDEVPVSPNPAYRQVTSIALQENSAYSVVHTVSLPAAAVAEYENTAGLQHT